MATFCSARGAGAVWHPADVRTLPFPDPSFDLVAAGSTVEEEQGLTLRGRAASTADLANG
ncbi:hypothetical protein ABZ726_18405 [Streptomyces hundungensis]|uniref:hypothetical protein n=1 Tax=Streptomyces hundungensis TaxID=1077946 RepID=UPI0033BFC87F